MWWERLLGILADIIQVGTFFDFDKVTKVPHTNDFTLLLVLIAWLVSIRRREKVISAMQLEIDRMASENRLFREEILRKRGLTLREIKKLFPPDDNRKTRRTKK